MATLLYNNHPSLRPSRALSTMLADMLRESQSAPAQPISQFIPAADVLETTTGFELHLALPGVKKEAVNIEFIDGELVVAGERPHPAAPAKEATLAADETTPAEAAPVAPKFRRTETSYGAFRRSFRLPDTVSVKGIGAEFADGILRITLPFDTEKVTKQHIAIR